MWLLKTLGIIAGITLALYFTAEIDFKDCVHLGAGIFIVGITLVPFLIKGK